MTRTHSNIADVTAVARTRDADLPPPEHEDAGTEDKAPSCQRNIYCCQLLATDLPFFNHTSSSINNTQLEQTHCNNIPPLLIMSKIHTGHLRTPMLVWTGQTLLGLRYKPVFQSVESLTEPQSWHPNVHQRRSGSKLYNTSQILVFGCDSILPNLHVMHMYDAQSGVALICTKEN